MRLTEEAFNIIKENTEYYEFPYTTGGFRPTFLIGYSHKTKECPLGLQMSKEVASLQLRSDLSDVEYFLKSANITSQSRYDAMVSLGFRLERQQFINVISVMHNSGRESLREYVESLGGKQELLEWEISQL